MILVMEINISKNLFILYDKEKKSIMENNYEFEKGEDWLIGIYSYYNN